MAVINQSNVRLFVCMCVCGSVCACVCVYDIFHRYQVQLVLLNLQVDLMALGSIGQQQNTLLVIFVYIK